MTSNCWPWLPLQSATSMGARFSRKSPAPLVIWRQRPSPVYTVATKNTHQRTERRHEQIQLLTLMAVLENARVALSSRF